MQRVDAADAAGSTRQVGGFSSGERDYGMADCMEELGACVCLCVCLCLHVRVRARACVCVSLSFSFLFKLLDEYVTS